MSQCVPEPVDPSDLLPVALQIGGMSLQLLSATGLRSADIAKLPRLNKCTCYITVHLYMHVYIYMQNNNSNNNNNIIIVIVVISISIHMCVYIYCIDIKPNCTINLATYDFRLPMLHCLVWAWCICQMSAQVAETRGQNMSTWNTKMLNSKQNMVNIWWNHGA